ncbi:hypothetical protein POM88_013862 [Heracleum sosnowskyi]|uniref:C3H1-type domain-containing protein n=1 Tax=Heracleum sosnowskyi TaxID=360622 RepID=A0AAD8J012_9APIA|nr:hypothetical protein POM88_013862 [Heracleum sosnowskyi]
MEIPTDCSWILKKVISFRTLARRFLTFTIGNGNNTSLWFDPWWNNTCLASKVVDPIISQAYSNKLATVNTLILSGRWILPRPNPRRHHFSNVLQSWLHDFVPPTFDLDKRDDTLWNDTLIRKITTSHIWDAIRFKLPEALATRLHLYVPSTWMNLITNWGAHPSEGHRGIALLTTQRFDRLIFSMMEIKVARSLPGKSLEFDRVKVGGGVCRFWMAGCCKRSDCRFLHPEVPVPGVKKSWKNPNYHVPKTSQIGGIPRRKGHGFEVKSAKKACDVTQIAQTSETKDVLKRQNKKQLCKYWVTGNCVYGDQCKNLHSWYYGDGFTMLAKLNGHTKAVTGIALPSGSDMLYSVSKDKSMRVWNCHTGQCGEVVNFDDECGSLMCEGPCIFVGLPSAIKAWNIN